jgi:hypothetical protein
MIGKESLVACVSRSRVEGKSWGNEARSLATLPTPIDWTANTPEPSAGNKQGPPSRRRLR